jgi:predicted metal-dependent peptidase
LAIYIDQSGSVDNNSLELLFGTLRDLSSLVSFTVFHFDTEVDEKSETVWSRGKSPEVHRTRSGGTNFSAPTKHANKNKNRFDGYLILTDGEAPDPGPSRLKRGWVVIPGRSLQFGASRRDFVIKMKNYGKTN